MSPLPGTEFTWTSAGMRQVPDLDLVLQHGFEKPVGGGMGFTLCWLDMLQGGDDAVQSSQCPLELVHCDRRRACKHSKQKKRQASLLLLCWSCHFVWLFGFCLLLFLLWFCSWLANCKIMFLPASSVECWFAKSVDPSRSVTVLDTRLKEQRREWAVLPCCPPKFYLEPLLMVTLHVSRYWTSLPLYTEAKLLVRTIKIE